jgi:hypothetical protein
MYVLTGGVARGAVGRAAQRVHVVGEALAREGGVGAPQLPKHVGKLRRQRQQLHLQRVRRVRGAQQVFASELQVVW